MFRSMQPTFLAFTAVLTFAWATTASAQTISIVNTPTNVTVGNTQPVTVNYNAPVSGLVQVQLFNSSWNLIANKHVSVSSGSGQVTLDISVPGSTPTGSNHIWQAILYNNSWVKLKEQIKYNITLSSGNGEWTPPGSNWTLDWNDEFNGTGLPGQWFPMLGYNPDAYANNTEKALRWTGNTANTAWMYSTKTGNHWLNGNGKLVMRAISDKTSSNVHGHKAKTAYLMSGYPDVWDSSEPNGVKWAGKFVSPTPTPLYISCRVRTDQVKGYSTWFAFWLFSQTRAYNDNPADGTEVDIMEVPKGQPNYLDTAFNVANHWKQSGGSESKQFNTASSPKSTDLVDVSDANYHVWGIEWTPTLMKCYVDGQLFYTFDDHIPSNPVDMMMMLTLEFQKDAWDPNQGDGRFTGPYVSDNSTMREMSRAYVDYVRIYKKN